MVEEMIKFRQLLDDHNISWEDDSEKHSSLHIDRTHFTYKDNFFSVINGFGTYGGYDRFLNKNLGLLELMSNAVNEGEPVGMLTATEAFKLVIGG